MLVEQSWVASGAGAVLPGTWLYIGITWGKFRKMRIPKSHVRPSGAAGLGWGPESAF